MQMLDNPYSYNWEPALVSFGLVHEAPPDSVKGNSMVLKKRGSVNGEILAFHIL